MATNNRFKKSIENAIDNTQDNIPHNILEITIDNTQDNIPYNILENAIDNINDDADAISFGEKDSILKKVLQTEKRGRGGNHTLYLSADVGDALSKYAKRAKKSKSTLVDEILREVLIN